MPDQTNSAPDDLQVKINFRVPPRMPSVYAQHMFVQPGLHEVVLSFFEILAPIFTGPQVQVEDRIKTLQEAGVVAECVARVTIPKASFSGFADAMQQIADQISSAEEPQNANDISDNPEG